MTYVNPRRRPGRRKTLKTVTFRALKQRHPIIGANVRRRESSTLHTLHTFKPFKPFFARSSFVTCSISGSSAPMPSKRTTRSAARAAARRGMGLELHRHIMGIAIDDDSPLRCQGQRAGKRLLRQLAPRDELETMQVHQLLWTHERSEPGRS